MGWLSKRLGKEVVASLDPTINGFQTQVDFIKKLRLLEGQASSTCQSLGLNCEFPPPLKTDDASIARTEISPQNDPTPISERKYVIHFMGNDVAYQQRMDEFIDEAYMLKCHVVAFNYRGVGDSEGAVDNQDNLIKDARALIKDLTDKGVKPENIVLSGHSLGAAVATLTAAELHNPKPPDKKQPVKLFNNRGFSDSTEQVVSGIKRKNKFLSGALGWAIKPVVNQFFKRGNWQLKADEAYQKIPDEYKMAISAKGDSFIVEEASLQSALPKDKSLTTLTPSETAPETDPHQQMLSHLHVDDKNSGLSLLANFMGTTLLNEKPPSVKNQKSFNELRDLIHEYYTEKNPYVDYVGEIKEICKANPQVLSYRECISTERYTNDMTILQYAALYYNQSEKGDSAPIQALVESGADVHQTTVSHDRPLMILASQGKFSSEHPTSGVDGTLSDWEARRAPPKPARSWAKTSPSATQDARPHSLTPEINIAKQRHTNETVSVATDDAMKSKHVPGKSG